MPRRLFVSGAVLCLLAGLYQHSAGRAEEHDPAAAEPNRQGESELYLEVFINGRPTGLIAAFQEQDGQPVAATADELREIGLQSPDEGVVPLSALPGVSYEYDEAAQAIRFTAGNAALVAQAIWLRPPPSDEARQAEAGWGAFANYTLFAAVGSEERLADGLDFQGVSGGFDAHVYSPYGSLETSALVRLEPDAGVEALRLATRFTHFNIDRMMTYRAGDTISGGLSWTRPVRLAGLQVQRDFSLRPDLVTIPLPSFEGSAAVPSTVEVFSDSVRIYTGEVDAGPFVLSDVPVATGATTTTIIVRDALGRDVATQVPFYASPNLLRSGIFDFSVEAGFPRRSFGVESFDYDGSPFGAFTLRYGVSDRFTAEAHGEVGEELLNGGAGAVFTLGSLGAASASLAGSNADGESGAQASLAVEVALPFGTAFGRVQRSIGDYQDLASVSVEDQEADDDFLLRNRPLKELDQIGVSFELPFDPSRISVNYARREAMDGEEQHTASLSLGRQLGGGIFLHATAVALIADDEHYGAFAGISFPLGAERRGNAGVRYDRNGPVAYAEVSHPERREPGEIGWRAGAEIGADDGVYAGAYAAASYRSSAAQLRASAEYEQTSIRATAEADGAVVFAGGDFFLSHRINDAFAVVDAGAPDVGVFYENRPIGTTDRDGRLVIPNLRALEENRISIDPIGLPLDIHIPSARKTVSPLPRSGVMVDFDVASAASAALVSFRDEVGQPIELGSTVQLAGQGEASVVGYDGEVYMEGLSEKNEAVITTPNGSVCKATFDFAAKEGAQVRIDAVVCMPD